MRGYRSGARPPRFLTHRAGISALTGAIAGNLQAEIKTSTPVDRIFESGDGLLVVAGGESWVCDAAIICLPGRPASAVIADLAPEAARLLATIKHASVASIALVFPASGIPAPPGSGVLLPSRAPFTISAATWWSLKWPHAAPQDRFVVRAFVGRAGHHPAIDLPDAELVGRALDDLRSMITLRADPVLTEVTRWPDALPQYEVGHLDIVRDIETALPPTLAVAGADLRGSGIPDCHDQGVAAATRISRALQHK
jgi:oxygen-dependent protoporphyrinogen oxidase